MEDLGVGLRVSLGTSLGLSLDGRSERIEDTCGREASEAKEDVELHAGN